jgi:carbonic anhydrase
MCGGFSQSPVDIASSSPLGDILALNVSYPSFPTPATLENSGTILKLTLQGNVSASISGAGLPADTYNLDSIIFHWSPQQTSGSEHTIDGLPSPMEMQLQHYDASYASFEDALASSDPSSIAIVAVLFQLSANPNGQLYPIVAALSSQAAANGQSLLSIPALSLGYLTAPLTPLASFFRYKYVNSHLYLS